ncbi:MAG: carboxypeptidase regulatory-like domain-containing protein [Candidatus Moraniibacteriota bacterium]|nr:MAG: carboxypeptidase regulatory-like domain-containing protein [Candidatus Moranbacteria bacterium]
MSCYWKVLLIALTFVWPMYSRAACPTQETAILYINGVDSSRGGVERSRKELEKEVLAKTSDNSKDCLIFDDVYNTNEPLYLDFLEAGLQKAEEEGEAPETFWRLVFRLASSNAFPWFSPFVDDLYGKVAREATLYVLGDQTDEHLVKYREHLALGRRIVLVPHSQGSLYANEEWQMLSTSERSRVKTVAVATPSDRVASGGSYTTLFEDNFARYLFILALPANAANTEPCEDDYLCHGFRESYLRGTNSRTRIVNDILALLPVPVTGGTIEGVVDDGFGGVLPGWDVRLYRSVTTSAIAATVSDAQGRYRLAGITAGTYLIRATTNGDAYGFQQVTVTNDQTIIVNFPPPVPL